MSRPWRRAHPVLCLGAAGLLLLGLFAFPESAGQDPYHIHVVIGGTAAERARALMLHILRERAGIDGGSPSESGAGVPAAARRVRVLSIQANNDDGGTVFSATTIGTVLSAAVPPVPAPSETSWIAADSPPGTIQTGLSILDPPPRRA